MAPSKRISIVVIDDGDGDVIIIDDNDDDLEIIKNMPSQISKVALLRQPATNKRTTQSIMNPRYHSTGSSSSTTQSSTSSSETSAGHSYTAFHTPNWSFLNISEGREVRTTQHQSRPHSRVSRGKTRSTDLLSFALSPSPTTESPASRAKLGTASTPIELEDDDLHELQRGMSVSRVRADDQYHSKDGPNSLATPRKLSRRQDFVNSEEDGPISLLAYRDGTSALVRSMRRLPTRGDVLIEIDSLEQHEVPGFCEQDVYLDLEEDASDENARRSILRKSPQIANIERRNPTIAYPLTSCESYAHGTHQLRPNKTVELRDGDFLRIKDIILNSRTNEVSLRGHRLQRVKDLNGMLEKKLNEVLLYREIDLDDPRDPYEQSAIEVSVAEVVKLRGIRYTNQKFPLCRNFNRDEFRSKEEIALEGGLTARWKYTCVYANASSRLQNTYKERTLERISSGEATAQFSVSKSTRRWDWRGETIPGGAYRPTIDPETEDWQRQVLFRQQSPISIDSSPEPEEHTFTGVNFPESLMFTSEGESETAFRSSLAKRKFRSDFGQISKRLRQKHDDPIEENRHELSRVSSQIEKSYPRSASDVIDLSDDDNSMIPSLPKTINLVSSDLATPPPTGDIRSQSISPRVPVARLAGQMLTYGDAFCGAGGTTRGAAMAGLRVKWGFDFNKHACGTWRTNFPYASCYQEFANDFIQIAKRAEAHGFLDVMKVDILHLSPPCQYFSPAHSVNGLDDEMNVASLFAVQSVIVVSKARVVTLEQTFGIVCPRFRFYFNAVIQMFTMHDFSVRWSIMPMSQWGLPQRRNRLIIIACCPGETLPKMPAQTHSDHGINNLKPFVSVAEALASIPPNAPDHVPDALAYSPNCYRPPWDDSGILPRSMTCNGGQNYHPSGKRDFTLREYATLQGFPPNHVFTGSYVKKQIGNAVPPVIAKVLFESIKKDLDRADGILEAPELIE